MAIDFVIKKGETARLPATVYTTTAQTTPQNVTGASVTFRIGDAAGSVGHLSKAGSVEDGINGEILVTLTDTETNTLTNGIWDYQFIVSDGTNVIAAVEGHVQVLNLIPEPS